MKKLYISLLFAFLIFGYGLKYISANSLDHINAFDVELPYTYNLTSDIDFTLNNITYNQETNEITIDYTINNDTSTPRVWYAINNELLDYTDFNSIDTIDKEYLSQTNAGFNFNFTDTFENSIYIVMYNASTFSANRVLNLNFEYIEPPSIIDNIFTWLLSVTTGFIAIMITLFSNNGVVSILYDSTNGLTIVGGLLLLMAGLFIVRWAFSFVSRLIQMRR